MSSKSTKSKGASASKSRGASASKSKGAAAPRLRFIQARSLGARTQLIEEFILNAGAPVTVKQIKEALAETKCADGRPVVAVVNHVSTLYHNRCLVRDDATHAYSVRPEVLAQLKAQNGAPVRYGAVAQLIDAAGAKKGAKSK